MPEEAHHHYRGHHYLKWFLSFLGGILMTSWTSLHWLLSLAGACGNVEKPWWDMAFLLITPSLTIGCKRVFCLTTVWAHPHQACFQTLEKAACKLVLLVDVSMDWPYTFVWLNDAISYAPLSDEGHVSTMMYSTPAWMPTAGSTSCRYANCCSLREG